MASTEEIFASLRGNYRSYTETQKLQALDLVNEKGVRAAASLLKIPKSTIATWKSQLRKVNQGPKSQPVKKLGRPLSYSTNVEEDIYRWILRRREQDLPVTRFAIADYAVKKVTAPGFKASNGWVDKFLRRNKLVLKAKTSLGGAQRLPADLEEKNRIFMHEAGPRTAFPP